MDWLKAHPPKVPKDNRLANLFLAGALILFGIQFVSMRTAIERSRYAAEPPIKINSPIMPERSIYYPGEAVVFQYRREVIKPGDVILQIDSFINTESGEGYSSAILARTVERAGEQEFRSVRKLPDYIRPGRYRLEGFALSQTPVRSLPAVYFSVPFTVGAKGK